MENLVNKQGLLENLSDLIAAPRDECTWIFFSDSERIEGRELKS